MTTHAPGTLDHRVLLRTATARDAALALEVLQRAHIEAVVCPDADCLEAHMRQGVGALLLAEEVLADPAMHAVNDRLAAQAPWSDVPVLVLARPGADSGVIREAMERLANVTVIERPLRIAALVSTVRSALRARQRQYDMRRLLDGLREADQRKTEFLATLAHELRNPLAPLSTALALLKLGDIPAVEARDHFDMMERQVDHMVRLIDDLMEVSRITRGKIALRLEAQSLRQVLQDAIELAAPALAAGDHALDVSLPDRDWTLMGDGVRLNQVFANLLNNAAKYTPSGGRVQVGAERHGDTATVRITDNGVGISPAMLPHVFDMFVQAGGASRVAQGGLGIGLTLVRSLVEMHGGRVRAHSAGDGLGTEIAVELPLTAGLVPTTGDGAAHVVRGPLRGPVLVVDDNADAANTLAMYLDAIGAETDVAYDGTDALQKATARRFAAAVLDIGMPGMDGCELARRLRDLPGGDAMLLVALSGWGQAEDRERVAAAGFDEHLLKPPDIAALTALLQER